MFIPELLLASGFAFYIYHRIFKKERKKSADFQSKYEIATMRWGISTPAWQKLQHFYLAHVQSWNNLFCCSYKSSNLQLTFVLQLQIWLNAQMPLYGIYFNYFILSTIKMLNQIIHIKNKRIFSNYFSHKFISRSYCSVKAPWK